MTEKLLCLVPLGALCAASLAGCDQTVDDQGDGQSVVVVYQDDAVDVDLGDLGTVDVEGIEMVPLTDVVATAELGVALEELRFDFVASDGFHPRSSPNCTDDMIPLPGSDLELGYIDPVTRDLFWDEDLGLPSCVRVDDVERILVSDDESTEG